MRYTCGPALSLQLLLPRVPRQIYCDLSAPHFAAGGYGGWRGRQRAQNGPRAMCRGSSGGTEAEGLGVGDCAGSDEQPIVSGRLRSAAAIMRSLMATQQGD